MRAVVQGPGGPVYAIINGAVIAGTIIQAIRFWTVPSVYKFLGLFVGIAGMLVLTL